MMPDKRGGAAVIRVVVICGIRLYREGLADLLSRADGIVVLGTAADAPSVVSCVAVQQPDIALLDMTTPQSVSMLQLIGEVAPAVKVVGIAVGEREPEILASVEAGVAGYVLQEDSLNDLLLVMQSVVREEAICSPRVVARLMHRLADLASQQRQDGLIHRLTIREKEIASLMAGGMTNKEIASRLSLRLPTVKNHVHNILEKLQLRRRGQTAALLDAWGARRWV